jgi:pyruvate dehydrogenase E2 component (dihydrolipoamide acetyltransferase)
VPEFKLPDLGEGVTEAEVDRWLVSEGDSIEEDAPLVEVITDKATAEIPSPFEGVVKEIHVPEGEVASVGTVLVTIESESDGESTDVAAVSVASRSDSATKTVAAPAASVRAPASRPPSRPGVKAMPPVRQLARKLGIDIAQIRGSGPNGRILRNDVEELASQKVTGPPSESAQPGGEERREPLRGIRRLIAERMSYAHQSIPPVTHVEECDVTELDATRRLANERDPEGVKLTFLPFIVKAVVAALEDYPAMNASIDEAAHEIVYHGHYDIGVAVETPDGLVVPVVRNADSRRLVEIAREIHRLARGAREGTLDAADLKGGTFTVTSPGPFGGLMATPIVMAPQSGILGVHRAIDRPVVRDGQIVVRKIMNLSVTFDHRVLDGMTAARFVLDVVKLLEHPAVLALES